MADVQNYFKFIDFKKNLKVGLSSVGKMYVVSALLRNALTCLYGNETTVFSARSPKPARLFCLTLSTFDKRDLECMKLRKTKDLLFRIRVCETSNLIKLKCYFCQFFNKY